MPAVEYFLIVVVILLVLAVLDLIVGVSNDAVNFLNSAIGSRVAPYKIILLVAIAGIIVGSVFSSGIMEIARKGIFNPQFFTFDKVMVIFLAVMLVDVILLDVFNTLGLPTSTTVSIVFELLGASLVTGLFFASEKGEQINEVFKYINTSSVISIISGIFLSILIAFTIGTLLQYITRLMFSFQYQKMLKKLGAIYSGLGLTAIIYFLLIKGLKGTTLFSPQSNAFIVEHTNVIIAGVFFVLTTGIYLLQYFSNVNPLKIVVLAGTFALAMAFAGNDLVNFVGVPVTGLLGYQAWKTSGVPLNESYQEYMASGDFVVPNYMLLIAGIIMALTLWFSAKARKVTETEVSLGRQDEGAERFTPNAAARGIVNSSLALGRIFSVLIPGNITRYYDRSFKISKLKAATNVMEKPAFDLLRASNNLVVSSALIALATSFKLPLSTTYVTFMVAMGSSLADRAWGRESAVYRVAGVLSVIGGWFITAVIALTASGLFAFILLKGGVTGSAILIIGVFAYLIASHFSFAKKERKAQAKISKISILDASDSTLVEKNRKMVVFLLEELKNITFQVFHGLEAADGKVLEKSYRQLIDLDETVIQFRNKNIKSIQELDSDDVNISSILLNSTDLIQDLLHSIQLFSKESTTYVKNLHQVPGPEFMERIDALNKELIGFFTLVLTEVLHPAKKYNDVRNVRSRLRSMINANLAEQLSLLKQRGLSTKQGILQTTIFLQARDAQAVLMRIYKMFYQYDKRYTGEEILETEQVV